MAERKFSDRQRILADFGDFVLDHDDLDEILTEGCRLVALHELATNAIKYGALGQPDVRLAVTWSLEPDGADGRPWLHIDWRETGVQMPAQGVAAGGTGQGRELIEQALPYQLGARTTYEHEPDGVHCTIAVSVSETPPEAQHD